MGHFSILQEVGLNSYLLAIFRGFSSYLATSSWDLRAYIPSPIPFGDIGMGSGFREYKKIFKKNKFFIKKIKKKELRKFSQL